MSDDNSQPYRRPVFKVNLGANGGEISFDSIEQVRPWIDEEIMRWEQAFSALASGENAIIMQQLDIVRKQLCLPTKIKESLAYYRSHDYDEEPIAIRRISKLFGCYKDYQSLCSKSGSGRQVNQLLLSEDSRVQQLAIGGLLGSLQVPVRDLVEIITDKNPVTLYAYDQILLGYTTWRAMNFLEIPDILEQMSRFEAVICQAEEQSKKVNDEGTKINEEAATKLQSLNSDWSDFREAAERERKGLEEVFEEHMRFHAPATYWRDRADSTSKTAKRALAGFLIGAFAIVVGSVTFGPGLLERLAAVEGTGSFAPLALVSVPALMAFWCLRHVARLFVANVQRSDDARMRETMATTFLALTREQGAIDREERLLVLEALFRPPSTAGTDDGHYGGVLEILTRRNPSA